MGSKAEKSKTRKRTKDEADGVDFVVGIRDFRLMLDDHECFIDVPKHGEVVVSLELPEEPTKDDLVEAEKLQDRVNDLVDDLRNELGVSDEEADEDSEDEDEDLDDEEDDEEEDKD